MGGRGSKSSGGSSGGGGGGGFGGYGSLKGLIEAANAVNVAANAINTNPNQRGTYDAGGNPDLIKYQGQDDDKTARFLAKVWNQTDLSQFQDGYSFYNNSFQKLVLNLGLNAGPTVMDDKDFQDYVKQTGAEVKYRGVSGKDAADRFLFAQFNHVGSGAYGDGHYFSNGFSTAESYGRSAAINKGNPPSSRKVLQMALSPKASVIDYSTLRSMMYGASSKLQSGLKTAGSKGDNSYGPNQGEAQYALKMGYNVIRVSNYAGSGSYEYGLTRDAFVVSKKYL